MSASAWPAWIRAWEAGVTRGRAARTAGESLADVLQGDASAWWRRGGSVYVAGLRHGHGDVDPVEARPGLLPAVVEGVVLFLVASLVPRRAAEGVAAVFGLGPARLTLALTPRRPAARGDVPPRLVRPGTTMFRFAFFRAARRRGGARRLGPATALGLGVALAVWQEGQHRADEAAWRAFAAARPDLV